MLSLRSNPAEAGPWGVCLGAPWQYPTCGVEPGVHGEGVHEARTVPSSSKNCRVRSARITSTPIWCSPRRHLVTCAPQTYKWPCQHSPEEKGARKALDPGGGTAWCSAPRGRGGHLHKHGSGAGSWGVPPARGLQATEGRTFSSPARSRAAWRVSVKVLSALGSVEESRGEMRTKWAEWRSMLRTDEARLAPSPSRLPCPDMSEALEEGVVPRVCRHGDVGAVLAHTGEVHHHSAAHHGVHQVALALEVGVQLAPRAPQGRPLGRRARRLEDA